jgi:hypothetical protein
MMGRRNAMTRFIGPTILLLLLVACEEGNGVFDSITHCLPAFSQIENRSQANLYLSVEPSADDSETRISVTGDQNLIRDVEVFVTGDTLVVDTHHSMWPSLELRVIATVARLDDFENSGSGEAHINGLNGNDLAIYVTGSGDVTASGELDRLLLQVSGSGDTEISGSATDIDLDVSGSGDIKARRLAALDASVRISGSGDVEVCVTGELDATISGSGDIDYFCNPDAVHRFGSGSGDITGH